MTDRTAMMPVYPSVDTTIGAGGTGETAPVNVPAGDTLTVDLFTTAAAVRVAHGSPGIDATAGMPLIANSKNTLQMKRGDVLAFAGAENDVVIYTVLT